MTKFFRKSKKPYFGAIPDPLCLNFGENEFSWQKRALSVLKISLYHCDKNQKKLIVIPQKNCKLLDKQTENSDFMGPSLGQGSNY